MCREKEIACLNRLAETPEQLAALKLHSPVAKRLARASRYRGRDMLQQSKQDKMCYLNTPIPIKQVTACVVCVMRVYELAGLV
jgi:hypothetical protein